MPIKNFFRGGDDSGSSESGNSHGGGSGGGGRRESAFGNGKQALNKVARALLLQNNTKKDRVSERPYFNPEEHISQKREWSRRYTQQEGGGGGDATLRAPDRLFEHFAIVVRLAIGRLATMECSCWLAGSSSTCKCNGVPFITVAHEPASQ